MDPHRVLRVLGRARLWLLLALLIGAALGIGIAKYLMPRTYVSVASLVYEGVPVVDGIASPGETPLPTLLDSVELPSNLRLVRERVGSEQPLDELGKRISVSVERDSNVMNVSGEARSPNEAAELSEAMVSVFLEHRTELERRRLQEHLDGLDEDMRIGREALSQARERYDAFREEHGISDLSTEQERAIEAAASLRAQADMAAAEANAEEARLRELQQAVRQQNRTVVTEVQTSAESGELGRLRSELAQAEGSLSDDHPRVQSLRQRVEALSQRVAGGSTTVTDRTVGVSPGYEALQGSMHGSSANREAARQREQALEQLAADARERLRSLTEMEGRASALLASVRVAEGHLESLEGRRRGLVDALRSPSAGFRVVSQAMPPEHPVDSKGPWVVAAAFPFVFVLGVLAFFAWRELRGLKVVTPVEVGYWGKGPVLGATMWPHQRDGVYELVSELDDCFPEAHGLTLIVGATEHEERYAVQLADRLRDDWEPTTYITTPSADPGRSGTHSRPRSDPPATGTALALREPTALANPGAPTLDVQPYAGPSAGPKLRRAARLADRVVVVVESGRHSAVELLKVRSRLGRDDVRVGFLVVGLPREMSELPDRTGDVGAFWTPAPPKAAGEPPSEAA